MATVRTSIPSARITITHDGDALCIAVAGRLDEAARTRVLEAIGYGLVVEPSALALDLAEVESIDGVGLDAVIVAWMRAAERGVPLAVHHPSPTVRHLLRTSGITATVPIDD